MRGIIKESRTYFGRRKRVCDGGRSSFYHLGEGIIFMESPLMAFELTSGGKQTGARDFHILARLRAFENIIG